MRTQIANFLLDTQSKQKSGLLLLDCITGQGKTTSAIYVMSQLIKENKVNNGKKIFYETTSKINIPKGELINSGVDESCILDLLSFEDSYDKLFNIFNSSGTKDFLSWFQQKTDFILDGVNKQKKEEILDNIESFSKSIQKIFNIKKDKKDYSYSEIIKLLQHDTNIKERKFRRIAKEYIKRKISQHKCDRNQATKKTIKEIVNDEKYSILGLLYPGIYLFDDSKKIVLVSTSKTLCPIETLFYGSVKIYENPEFIKNNILLYFKDEIDQSFNTMLEKICEEASENNVDLFAFASFLIKISSKNKIYLPNNIKKSNEKAIEKIIEINKKFSDRWGKWLRHSIKANVQEFNIIYFDSKRMMKKNDEKKDYEIKYNADKNINEIYISKSEEIKTSFSDFVKDLYNYIILIEKQISLIAISYRENYNKKISYNSKENSSFEEEISLNDALSSVFHALQIPSSFLKFSEQFLVYSNNYLSSKEIHENEFLRGFSYTSIIQDLQQNEQDAISAICIENSPEKQLITLAENTLVVGLSATCFFDTTVKNFSIDVIKEELSKTNNYIEISEDWKEKILLEYLSRFSEKENAKINVVAFGDVDKNSNGFLYDLREIFRAPDKKGLLSENDALDFVNSKLEEITKNNKLKLSIVKNSFFTDIFSETNKKNPDYKTISRFSVGLDCALGSKNKIKSIISFSTKGFRENDDFKSLINIIVFLKFVKYGVIKSKQDFDRFFVVENETLKEKEKIVYYSNSCEFKKERNAILKNLSLGKYCFIIVSYNTLSKGQNMVYPVPFDELMSGSIVGISKNAAKKIEETKNFFKEEVETMSLVLNEATKAYDTVKNEYEKNIIEPFFSIEEKRTIPYEYKDKLIEIDFGVGIFGRPTQTLPDFALSKPLPFGCERQTILLSKIFRLKQHSGLSEEKYEKMLKKALIGSGSNGYKDIQDIIWADLIEMVQAIGRTQRKEFKHKNNYIIIDSCDLQDLSWEEIEYNLAENFAIEEIKNKKEEICGKGSSMANRYVNIAKRRQETFKTYSNSLVDKIFDKNIFDDIESVIVEYSVFRTNILKHPTANMFEDKAAERFYLEISKISEPSNKYEYSTSNTGDKKQIENIYKSDGLHTLRVDPVSELLSDQIMKIKEVRKYFKENNILMNHDGSWPIGNYIIIPAVFEDIYKGEFGEVLCKLYFKHVIDKELCNVENSIFERMDFVLKDPSNVFIDAKYQNDETFTSKTFEEQLETKAKEKERQIRSATKKENDKMKFIFINMKKNANKQKTIKKTFENLDVLFVPGIFLPIKIENETTFYDICDKDVVHSIFNFILE